jgi:hypothetical protein
MPVQRFNGRPRFPITAGFTVEEAVLKPGNIAVYGIVPVAGNAGFLADHCGPKKFGDTEVKNGTAGTGAPAINRPPKYPY